jgi:hypothetical protein
MPDPLTHLETDALRKALAFSSRDRFAGKTREQKEDLLFRRIEMMARGTGVDLIDLKYKIHHLPEIDTLIQSICS